MLHFSYKVQVPQRTVGLVSRHRLLETLAPIQQCRLITISAPAGYGKTSLLIDFATSAPPLPVVWFTIDDSDKDPWDFLLYLVAAIEQQFPDSLRQTTALLSGRSSIPFPSAASMLIREIDTLLQHFVLILDDWHLVDGVANCRELVGQILARCRNCHLILASRTHPSLPDMMLLASRQQMIGLDEELLRFGPDEIAAVLQLLYTDVFGSDQIHALAVKSKGWITSVLLSVQSGLAAPVASDRRAERQIYQFLAEQVFHQQEDTVQQFLLAAALLEDITAERYNATFLRSDGGLLLDTALQQHLFINEIASGIFRFHPLFREFLIDYYRRSDVTQYRISVRKAADVYVHMQQWAQAFDVCVAADDLIGAHTVAQLGGDALYTAGRLETIERWFHILPLEILQAPLLCLHARVFIDQNRRQEAVVLTDLALARAEPDQVASVLVVQALCAWMSGRYEDAIVLARRVLMDTRVGDDERSGALRALGIAHHRLGQSEIAIGYLIDGLAVERNRGDVHRMAHFEHDLAVCYTQLGKLHEAEGHYQQADACWSTLGNAGLQAMSLNSQGVVQHMSGQYVLARATLQRAYSLACEAATRNYQALIQTSLGDLYADLQLTEYATRAYDEAQKLGGSAFVRRYLTFARIRLLVRDSLFEHALREIVQAITDADPTFDLLFIQAVALCGLRRYQEIATLLQQAAQLIITHPSVIEQARMHVLEAYVASILPVDSASVVDSLNAAVTLATALGHDEFLIVDALYLSGLLPRAQALGWHHAEAWIERQQRIHQAARIIQRDDHHHVLVVRTMGDDQLIYDDHIVTLNWLHAREVFYYLLAHPAGATSEELRDAIWPDLELEASRNALKQAIFQLRSVLPRALIESAPRQPYRINRGVVKIDYDVDQFLSLLEASRSSIDRLFRAVDLYTGMFLARFEHGWVLAIRGHLEIQYLQALRRTADHMLDERAYLDAVTLFRSILRVDPLDEAAHAGIIQCQLALGNRAAAIAQYNDLQKRLHDELGLDMRLEMTQLYEQLLQ